MAKLNAKQILAAAETQNQIYRIKKNWRRLMVFAAVLMMLLVLSLPFGIWFFIVSRRARLGITAEGFAISWFSTKAYAWSEIESFEPAPLNFGGGLLDIALAAAVAKRTEGVNGPIKFKLKGKRFPRMFPAHAIENNVAMAREMERRSGLTILAPAPGATTASPI